MLYQFQETYFFLFLFFMNPNYACDKCYDMFNTAMQLKHHQRRHINKCKIGEIVLQRNDADAFDCPVEMCSFSSKWSNGTF